MIHYFLAIFLFCSSLRFCLRSFLVACLLWFLSLTTIFSVSANETFDKISLTRWQSFLAVDEENYKNVLLAWDRERIKTHHTSYLCETKRLTINDPLCASYAPLYMESPYIFDHIIDYVWRSLDANPAAHYPWATLDPQAKERRDYINTQATEVKWAIPISLLSTFKKYRETQTEPLSWSHYSCNDLKKELENWSDLTLTQKYRAWCMIASCATSWLWIPKNARHYDACIERAWQRIEQEYDYIQLLVLQQGNQMLKTQRNVYINEYLFGRANTMIDKMALWEVYIDHMNNKYIEWTSQCREW